MANSADGKKKHSSKLVYTIHGKGRLYHPTSARHLTLIEFYLHTKGKRGIKVLTGAGRDVTAATKERAKNAFKESERLAKKRFQESEAKRLREEAEKGYYCDCAISSAFETPEQVPEDMHPDMVHKQHFPTKVPVDSDKRCLFCGYYATYRLTSPCDNKKLDPKHLKKRVYKTKNLKQAKWDKARRERLNAEKQRIEAEAAERTIVDAVRSVLKSSSRECAPRHFLQDAN